MWKWALVAAALVAGLAVVLMESGGSRDTPRQAPKGAEEAAEPAAELALTAPRRHGASQTMDAAVAEPEVDVAAPDDGKLDPQSHAFSTVLDETIPDRFRAALAKCERRGMDPDAKITIAYDLSIEGGRVSASNVRVERSTLENSVLEQCMVTAVQSTKWIDNTLPDFAEDQDVFLRIRSLDKYLSHEEQEASKARANLGE